MVEQAAGRGDDDLGAGAQRPDLRVEADAAIDGRGSDRVLGAIGAHALLDLEGELAGRGHDQGTDDPWAGTPGCVQTLEHGQDERGGLAGPGLGTGEDIAPSQDEGDRLALDRRRFCVPLLADSTEELGRQPETIE